MRRGASIGANSTVVCGTTIGRYAFIGAGSVVTRDVPDYALVYGNPARVRGWICACGIKLPFAANGATEEEAICAACGTSYRKAGGAVRVMELRRGNCMSTGAAAVSRRVPLLDLKAQHEKIRGEVLEAATRVIDSQKFILGEEVESFEREIAGYCQTQFAVGCASGSDALFLALMAAGIEPGDRVMTTPYTFFATAGAISRDRRDPGIRGRGAGDVQHRSGAVRESGAIDREGAGGHSGAPVRRLRRYGPASWMPAVKRASR